MVTVPPLSRPWINSKKTHAEDEAVYSYLLGLQLLNVGEVEKARFKLDEAYQRDRNSLDFALGYAEVLFVHPVTHVPVGIVSNVLPGRS